MIVYHGSYCVVDTPHISFSRDALDFGKGFYVTKIKEQAINWTNKFKRRGKNGYLNRYKLDIEKDEALKRLQYYKPNQQICIINQDIIDNYLKYEESREV